MEIIMFTIISIIDLIIFILSLITIFISIYTLCKMYKSKEIKHVEEYEKQCESINFYGIIIPSIAAIISFMILVLVIFIELSTEL